MGREEKIPKTGSNYILKPANFDGLHPTDNPQGTARPQVLTVRLQSPDGRARTI